MKTNLALQVIVAAMASLKAGKVSAAATMLEAVVASRHFPQTQRVLKAVAEEVAVPDDSFDADLDAGQIGEELRDELQAARRKARRVAAESDFDFEEDVVNAADDEDDADEKDDEDEDEGDKVEARRQRRFKANREHAALVARLKNTLGRK